MDNFENIQDAWKNQSAANLPEATAIKAEVNQLRKKLVSKNILGAIVLFITLIAMFYFLLAYDFEFLTTKIALVGMIATLSGAIIFILKLNNQMYKADLLKHSSKKYLQALKAFKTSQTRIHQNGISAYYILLTSFIALYIYEFYQMNQMIGMIAYALTALWILFAWFVIRPRKIAKDEAKINRMIAEVERIEEQLD